MSHLTSEQADAIFAAFERTGSLRATAKATGHEFRTVRRAIECSSLADAIERPARVGSAPEIDYDRLASLVASKLGASQAPPVNEGPPVPRPTGYARPIAPGVYAAPKIYERIGWLSDIHCPYHDPAAIEAAFQLFEEWGIQLLMFGGDQLDCYLLSRYAKSPGKLGDTFQCEIDAWGPIRDRATKLGCKVAKLEGNHDVRARSICADLPAFHELEALQWGNLLKLPEDWSVIPNQGRYRHGNLDFTHGDLKGRGAGHKHVASGMLAKLKRSTVFGHYHRAQTHVEPDGDGIVRGGFATGHMCDPVKAAEYCPINDWSQGFATIDTDPETEYFEVRHHLVHGGRVRFQGKTYGG